jgi:hypothetical protein
LSFVKPIAFLQRLDGFRIAEPILRVLRRQHGSDRRISEAGFDSAPVAKKAHNPAFWKTACLPPR